MPQYVLSQAIQAYTWYGDSLNIKEGKGFSSMFWGTINMHWKDSFKDNALRLFWVSV